MCESSGEAPSWRLQRQSWPDTTFPVCFPELSGQCPLHNEQFFSSQRIRCISASKTCSPLPPMLLGKGCQAEAWWLWSQPASAAPPPPALQFRNNSGQWRCLQSSAA